MTGHAWGAWTYDADSDTAADHSDSTHSRLCENDAIHTDGPQSCTFAIDATKYIAPTKTTEGSNTYVCSVCGHTYDVIIPNTMEHFDVTYDANGGKNAPAAQFVETRTGSGELVITSAVPTRDKYTFLGWSQSKSGNVQLKPGDKLSLTADITLYAVWEKKTDAIKTSDGSNAALWFAMAGLSAMCMFGAAYIGRKRRKN